MIKNYVSLNSITTLEFSNNSERKIASSSDFKIMKAFWFFMILMLLSLTTNRKPTANNKSSVVFYSSYINYHTVVLKSFTAHGHGGGGGHGYAFFSPTDHDKPIYPIERITLNSTNKLLQYNNQNTSTNIKTIQS